LIDERTLTKEEVRQFFVILFGEGKFDSVPDPNIDWTGFQAEAAKMVLQEDLQWNPIQRSLLPIIDIQQFNKSYGHEYSCLCSIM